MESAKKVTRMQFANYGMNNIPDDLLENYAKEMLNKQESVKNLVNTAIDEKLTLAVKDKVSLKSKELSMEKFNKLFEADMKAETEEVPVSEE